MTTIRLDTLILAPPARCFDLSLDIDLHKDAAADTQERVVAGRDHGKCELDDVITWEAVHFGIRQRLTVKIVALERPHFFEDMMLKGAFKQMRHSHHFVERNGHTLMRDIFIYEAPLGILGRLFDFLILRRHMTRFLLTRNAFLKEKAEQAGPA